MGYTYIKPKNQQELLTAMQKNPEYHILAGGTDVMVRVKLGRIIGGTFIDIGEMELLKKIEMNGNLVTVGAAVLHAELAASPVITAVAPALAAAAVSVGSPQIRNRGTLGGNVGNASPAGDTIPALLSYETMVNIVGVQGLRQLPLSEFFTGPGRTILQKSEYIESFSFLGQQKREGSAFEKLGKRKALSISVVNAAGFLRVHEDGTIGAVRISLGSVAATPIRMFEAEEWLCGQKISQELLVESAKKVQSMVYPIDDVRSEAVYRKKMAGVLTQRVLEKSWKLATM